MKSNNSNRPSDVMYHSPERYYRDSRDDNYNSRYNAYGREYNDGQAGDTDRERTNYKSRSNADNSYQSDSPYGDRNTSNRHYGQADDYRERNQGRDKSEYVSRTNYGRNDFDRYRNYEGNSGRGNYQDYNTTSRYTDNQNVNGNRNRYSERPGRDWDSRESGYYDAASISSQDNERDYPYGGTRRRDDRNWANSRNQEAAYRGERSEERYEDDRNLFSRMGDSIKDTWHRLTDRDDNQENIRRFNQRHFSNNDRSFNSQDNYNREHQRPDHFSDYERYRRDDPFKGGAYDDQARGRTRYVNDSYQNW